MSKSKAKTALLEEMVANILETDLLKKGFGFDRKFFGYFRTEGEFTEQIEILSQRLKGALSLTFALGMRHSAVEEMFWRIEQTEPRGYYNFSNKKDRERASRYSPTSWNYCVNTNWQWYVEDDLNLDQIEPRLHAFINNYAFPWFDSRRTLPQLLEHLKAPATKHDQTSFRHVRALLICFLLGDQQQASLILKEGENLEDKYWRAKFVEFVEKARILYPWCESIINDRTSQ